MDTYNNPEATGVAIVDRLTRPRVPSHRGVRQAFLSTKRYAKVSAEIEHFEAELRKDIDTAQPFAEQIARLTKSEDHDEGRLSGYSATIPTGFRWVHDRDMTSAQVAARNASINRKKIK